MHLLVIFLYSYNHCITSFLTTVITSLVWSQAKTFKACLILKSEDTHPKLTKFSQIFQLNPIRLCLVISVRKTFPSENFSEIFRKIF